MPLRRTEGQVPERGHPCGLAQQKQVLSILQADAPRQALCRKGRLSLSAAAGDMAPDPPSSQGLTCASSAGEGEAQVTIPSVWGTWQCRVAGSGCPQIQGACVLLCPGVQSQPHFCSEQQPLPDRCNARS